MNEQQACFESQKNVGDSEERFLSELVESSNRKIIYIARILMRMTEITEKCLSDILLIYCR